MSTWSVKCLYKGSLWVTSTWFTDSQMLILAKMALLHAQIWRHFLNCWWLSATGCWASLWPGPYGSSYGLASRAEQERNPFLFLTIQRWRSKVLVWCPLKASAYRCSRAFGHSLFLPHTPSLCLPVPKHRHGIHCHLKTTFPPVLYL